MMSCRTDALLSRQLSYFFQLSRDECLDQLFNLTLVPAHKSLMSGRDPPHLVNVDREG